jgi:hypothetical protein
VESPGFDPQFCKNKLKYKKFFNKKKKLKAKRPRDMVEHLFSKYNTRL